MGAVDEELHEEEARIRTAFTNEVTEGSGTKP